MSSERRAAKKRKTFETEVEVKLNLDGSGSSRIDTKINFFNHMLNQLSKHGGFDLEIKAKGDLEIDEHHTVEDVGITLGKAFNEALGDKKGIRRFADSHTPLDETLVRTAVDISGRSYLYTDFDFKREIVGDFSSELVWEFLKSFVNHAQITLHIDLIRGANCHHQIEAIFKSLALTLKKAVEVVSDKMPSTKGQL